MSIKALFRYLMFCTFLALPTSAFADPDAKYYIEKKVTGGIEEIVVKNNLAAIYEGILVTNIHVSKISKSVFCPPDKLALTRDQIFDIFERYVKENPWAETYPPSLVLLNAVKQTFPCK